MMEIPRPASPASSSASSLDSNGLPIGRIKCSKDKILIGDRHYQSATDALLAYLRQFETVSAVGGRNGAASSVSSRGSSRGTPTPTVNGTSDGETTPRSNGSVDLNSIGVDNKKDDVQQLLTSKVSAELKEEVTDTLREIKLKNLLKKAVSKSQKPGKTGLQQEVEAALARSAQLLEKVTMEDIQSTKKAYTNDMADSISDISLPTQLLLADVNASINNSSDSNTSQDLDDAAATAKRKNGHIYSYHTSDYLNRSLNSGLLSPTDILHTSHNLRQARQRHRRHNFSHDDLTLSNHPHNLSFSHQRLFSNSSASSNTSSKLSDNVSDNLRRMRSRSVPPNAIRHEIDTSQLLNGLNESAGRSGHGVPGWVNDPGLNSSMILSAEASKPAIPQWVEDVAKSDISVDNIIAQHNSRLVTNTLTPARRNKNLLSNSYSFSKSEGDLSKWNENDTHESSKFDSSLNLSHHSIHSSSLPHAQQPLEKHVTFTDSLSSSIPKASRQPTHSTPLRGHRRQHATSHPAMNGHGSAPASHDIPKAPASGVNGSDIDSDLKSSSLDTLALLTGRPHTRHKGQSILNGGSLASRMFPDAPLLSSIEQDRTALSPSSTDSHNGVVTSSDGLDGDRSWEKHTNAFKPPVPVGNSDSRHGNNDSDNAKKNSCSSLSGGNQPGSMETLKNMLFKLQKEDPSVTTASEPATVGSGDHISDNGPPVIPGLQDYDFQTEPGGHSLEKALHHLDRLKTLVKNTASNDLVNGVVERESSSTLG